MVEATGLAVPNARIPAERDAEFVTDGFKQVPSVISDRECETVATQLARNPAGVGSRCLLADQWCADLAKRLQRHRILSSIVPGDYVAVQCTYFEKSAERNWLVPVHQDLSIPVVEHVSHPALGVWSRKEGTPPSARMRPDSS
jgi:hypothetical protein